MSIYKKDQMRLNEYLSKKHSKEEIGIFYERYIGYLFEKEEYLVTYNGIREKLADLGRDIIAKKKNEVFIVQCKNWSKDSIIHAKHVHQLFGTAQQYQAEYPEKKINAVFISTADFSLEATEAAKKLKIELKVVPLRKDYPTVKCNINSKGKLYHLPCDDAKTYDNIQITERSGEAFVHTVEEAVRLGFESPYFRNKSLGFKKAS